jgi:hypothetical protein
MGEPARKKQAICCILRVEIQAYRSSSELSPHFAVDDHRGVELVVDAGERVAGGEDRNADRGFFAEAGIAGLRITLSRANSGWSKGGGSRSKTSRPAPAMGS